MAKAESIWATQDSTFIKRGNYCATRIITPTRIDSGPFEAAWDKVTTAGKFVMLEPNKRESEKDTHQTEISIVYNDNAIYVVAYLYNNKANCIFRQFSQCDKINAQTDLFGFLINTYNNRINQTKFFATVGNSLGDATIEGNREDFSFDVIFFSEVSFNYRGW